MADDTKTKDASLRERLTPEQYHVTQEKGTERAFTGAYWNTHDKGMYKCVVCGESLFSSDSKFDSGTGWPSFTSPVQEGAVMVESDYSHFMRRTEVMCHKCGAHLGHVFDDGPQQAGGLRYCINSCALSLEKNEG